MVKLTCDICGKLLAPCNDAMPTMKDHFHSIRIEWNFTGDTKRVDLCPRCEKRMIKYLRREAKMDLDVQDG